jgi:superkiller protein 3
LRQAWYGKAHAQTLTPAAVAQAVAQHVARGEFASTAALYRQALAQHPSDVTLSFHLAHLYALQHHTTAAEAAYQQALALDPRRARPRRLPTATPMESQRFQAALAAYQQAIVFASLAQGDAAQRAELWLSHQQFDAVTHYADTLLRTPEGRGAGRTLQGRLALAQHQVSAALTLLQQALAVAPDFAPAHYALGLAYYQQGSLQLAKHALATAFTLAPEVAPLAQTLAQWHMQTRAFDQALAVGEGLRATYPQQPSAYRILGHAWLALGEPARGLTALQTAATYAPQDPRSYYELGLGYRQDAQESAALQSFEQALTLNPFFLEALLQVVDMSLVKGETAKARERVLAHLQVVPNAPQLYTLLGSILFAEDERCRGNNNVHEVRRP